MSLSPFIDRCVFTVVSADGKLAVCARCGREIDLSASGETAILLMAPACAAPHVAAPPASFPSAPAEEFAEPPDCIHRGPVVRRATCTYCGARGRVAPVHACEQHGECTLWKALKGVANCASCDDRETAG